MKLPRSNPHSVNSASHTVERLAGLLVTGAAHVGQPCPHLGVDGVQRSPGSGGTPNNAAASGDTAVIRPAFGPSACRIRPRTSASSSSGSASNSRHNAWNAC
jgi:hypothetical protein